MNVSKVLIIDDEQPIISMMEDIMELFEIEMDGAESGKEALELLSQNDYDYIICDMNLPDMDGKEFYKKAVELKPSIKGSFAFSTGYSQDPEIKSFCEEHQIDFLAKPFRVEDIQNLFNK